MTRSRRKDEGDEKMRAKPRGGACVWARRIQKLKPSMSGAVVKPEPKTISFAEIVHGRDASVRVTEDGYLYVVDLAMVVTGRDRDYAAQVFFA